jgi:hypothetical protein
MITMEAIPDDADHRHRQDQAPGEAGEEEHEETRGRHQDRRAQVGLLGDEPDRQQQQADGDQEVAAADHALAALEVPGQGQWHGDLHELGGLDPGDPMLSQRRAPLETSPNRATATSSSNTDYVQRQGNAHHALGRNARGHPHHQEGHCVLTASVPRRSGDALTMITAE